jgi:cobalt-zinc-cadmium resistance protein CzcA
MLERLVTFATHNRFVVVFVVLFTAAVGVRSMQQLPIDAVPDVTNTQVQVLTAAPALGPVEVEQFITAPIERVMGGLPNLEEVRSLSKFGLSAITIVFHEGTDIYFARQLVSERLAEAREAIPAGYGSPQLGPISSGLGEIYQFEVKGEPMCGAAADTDACWTPMELRTILDWQIGTQLRSVPGVVELNTFGGELKTFQVTVDPRQLVARKLALSTVFSALERNNRNAGGAFIERGGEQLLIRGEGLVTSLDDIGAIVVDVNTDGTPVRISDIAVVELAPRVRQGAVTRDGRGEAVLGIAMMLLGENARTTSSNVRAKLDELAPSLPRGVTIDTYYDRTELVSRTISTVGVNLLEGGAFVLLVLLLLLGNARGAVLVATAIPLSMLATFIGMRALGVSGNLMSLGALDFGLIVDGSVVVIEHIVSRLGHRQHNAPGTMADAIAEATREVARPVVFAVAIILIVYVPVLTLEGVEGKMFKPMAITVVLALAASLLLALTWMPAMATLLFRGGVVERESALLVWAKRWYEPLLEKALRHPRRVVSVAVVVLLGSVGLVPLLGAEFIPRLDEGDVAIEVVRLPSISLSESMRSTTQLERVLLEGFADEVQTVVSKTGRPEIATDPMGIDTSDVFIMLKPRGQWKKATTKEALVEQMEQALTAALPGQNFSFSQPIELRTNELVSGVRSDVAVSIYGDDLDVLKQSADAVVAVLSAVPGAADVKAEQVAGLPVLRVRIDRTRIARYGINAEDVLDAVEAMGGRSVGEVFEGQRRFTLQVRLSPSSRTDVDAIGRLPIQAKSGTLIPLAQLADIVVEDGPAQVSRERASRRISVQANVRGRDLAGFVAEAQQRVRASSAVPAGYSVEWGGQFENLEAASARLAIAVPVALVLIFLLLFMTWGALEPALLISLNVPFAATGGVLALAVRGLPLSISAGVGFIALFGVAVLNGVVLMSQIRVNQSAGVAVIDAVRDAAKSRLRPVLMTALVASLGFVPMALSSSAGAEVQRPLATVVIGGRSTRIAQAARPRRRDPSRLRALRCGGRARKQVARLLRDDVEKDGDAVGCGGAIVVGGGQVEPDGCRALVLPARGHHALLGDDGAIVVLHGPGRTQAPGVGGRRGGRRKERLACFEAHAERRRSDDRRTWQRPGNGPADDGALQG